MKSRRSNSTEALRLYNRAYYLATRDRRLAEERERYKNDPAFREKRKSYFKKYRANLTPERKIKRREYFKLYARANRHKQKLWLAKNPEKRKAIADRYNKTEKGRASQMRNRTRTLSTPNGKINHRMSSAIYAALRANKNGRRWESLVGYTTEQLMIRLKSLFREGMTWEKLMAGEIHIDHIIPKSHFSFASTEDIQFRRCWALENIRPEWAKANIARNNKIVAPSQIALGI